MSRQHCDVCVREHSPDKLLSVECNCNATAASLHTKLNACVYTVIRCSWYQDL